jgi:2-polyprenyl-6-methoxyphenol hydroxylase-like FAD-dependent oxidoreductase
MEPASHDVVVVGASIAGTTAAVLFARRGLRVALLERHTDPATYKVICTHYIQASATPTIARLGLAETLAKAGAVLNSFELWTRWGWIRAPAGWPSRFPTHGYSIRRSKLDPMLRHLAASTPGIDLQFGYKVERLLEENGAVCGVVARTPDGQMHELRARLVLGADGRTSAVADLARLPTRRKPHGRFMYFAYFQNLPLRTGSEAQMWFLEPDVGYAFPNDDGVTLLACMPVAARLPEFKSDLEGAFRRFFEGLPEAPPIGGAERISPILGQLDMPNIVRQTTGPGVALVGDAALAADPLFGVGCGWAFQSAEWVVEATADALRDRTSLPSALRRYRTRHRKALAGHEARISDFSTGRPYNALERLMNSAAARDAASAQLLHEFAARHIRVRDFLAPSAIAHALWVNIRHALHHGGPRPTGGPFHDTPATGIAGTAH